jgi:hypothetical protein
VLHFLSQAVTRAAIDARAGELMMLHAAGICDSRTGASLALVAPSGTGKTTAAIALGQRWGYISDETVAFDRGLSIQMLPKPLSVVTAHGFKRQISPDELGLSRPQGPLRLAGIMVLTRDPSLEQGAEVTAVRTAAALPLIAQHCSYLSRVERPLHVLADAFDAVGGVSLVRYREAADLLAIVEQTLGGSA